jgi:hypothetical protein
MKAIFCAAVLSALLRHQLATVAFGDDSVDKLVGTAEVQGKLIAAEKELATANSAFTKALPSLPEYKAAQASFDECVAKLEAARASKDTAGVDAAARAKLEATRRRDAVKAELKANWSGPAEAKISALKQRLQELSDAQSSAKSNRALQEVQADRDWETKQAALAAEKRPFELKGDRLGMSLNLFKRKYDRAVEGDPKHAPFCSDENPNIDFPSLLYNHEEGTAGIVKGSATFPFEEHGLHPNFPTIAGVRANIYSYSFFNGQLYEITILFHQPNYAQVADALKTKYGNPNSSETQSYQNGFGVKFQGDVLTWKNEVSAMVLTERAGNADDSLLRLVHYELNKAASASTTAIRKSHAKDL